MSLVRALREVLQGREPSAHLIEEIIDGLKSESPVIRAAAMVAAFATINNIDYPDTTVDKLEKSLKKLLSDYGYDKTSNDNATSCHSERKNNDSNRDYDNGVDIGENISNEQRDGTCNDGDVNSGRNSEADFLRDYDIVGVEKIPVTEPYGWGYKQYVVEVIVCKPKYISE